jgi:membrane protease YdiL (CAAX protease family)
MLKLKAVCLISRNFRAQRYSLKQKQEALQMHTYLRNKPVWVQLIIFGGLTGGILFISFIIGVRIVAQFNHISAQQIALMTPADYARPELAGVIKGLLIVQFFGIFFIPSMIFAYLADPRPFAYAGLRPPQKASFFLVAVITMVAGYFTVELFGMINESIVHFLPKGTQDWINKGESDADGTLKSILSMKGPADLLSVIFFVGVMPAIGEELFFRGILQKFFIQIFRSAWPGIIFTGFLFSAFHMQFMGFFPRMALGIILGALYWYSGSIYTSMLGHFLFNTINVLLIYFGIADADSKSSTSGAVALVGVFSLALVVFLLNYLRKKSVTNYDVEFPPVTEPTIFDEPEGPL